MSLRRDEGGQTAVEYILLVAAIASIFLIAATVLRPLFKRMADFTIKTIDNTLFKEESFHRFPLRQ